MKGLLIKDFKFIKKHNFGFIIVAILFFCLSVLSSSSMYFAYYSGAMISLMPVFTMAYDENYKWNKYEAILPIKKSAIVLEKYLLLIIISVPAVMIEALLLHYVKGLSTKHSASLSYLLLFISFLSPAIVLPLNFRFGYLKGKIINLIVIGVMAASITAINIRNNTGETALEGQFTPQNDALLFAILGVILLLASFGLSIVLYKKREF